MFKLISLFFSFIMFYGCAVNVDKTPVSVPQRIVYVSTPLRLPVKPVIPKLSSSQLECVSDDTKKILLERDNVMKNYIKELETIITSTQTK